MGDFIRQVFSIARQHAPAVVRWGIVAAFIGLIAVVPFAQQILGATYTFQQTDWSGGITANTASHPSGQTGWGEYSTSTSMSAGASLQLGSGTTTSTQTTDTDFSAGTLASTVVSGSGSSGSVVLTSGDIVSSWDSSPPASTTIQSGSTNTFSDVEIVGSYAYYTGSSSLRIYDMSNPMSPSLARTVSVPGSSKLVISGNYAYVFGNVSYQKLYVVDISNPLSASVVASTTTNAAYSSPNDVAVGSNNKIYFLPASGSLYSIDISTPTSPGAPTQETTTSGFTRIFVHNSYIYSGLPAVGCDEYGCISTLSIYSWVLSTLDSSPASGSPAGTLTIFTEEATGDFYIGGIAASSTTLYASVFSDGNGGGSGGSVKVVNIANPASMSVSGTYNSPSSYYGSTILRVSGSRLFIAHSSAYNTTSPHNGGIEAVSISTPASPAYVGKVKTNGTLGAPSAASDFAIGSTYVAMAQVGDSRPGVVVGTAGYISSGTFESSVIDTGGNQGFGAFSWTATTPANTTLTAKVRSSANADMSGATAFSGCSSVTSGQDASGGCVTDGQRYVQYQFTFGSSDPSVSPTLQDASIAYLAYASSGSLTSSIYDSGDATNVMGEVSWDESSVPASSTVTVSVRTAADTGSIGAAGWADLTSATQYCSKTGSTVTCLSTALPSSLRNGSGDRYFQYKVAMTGNGITTPQVDEVRVKYVVNAPPQFNSGFGTNGIVVAQDANSASPTWGKVLIQYAVRDTDSTTGSATPGFITPTLEYNIGGGWVAVQAQYLGASDLSNKAVDQTNYTTHTATWDVAAQIPNTYSASAQIRITANDNEGANNTATATSGSFTLDTKAPVISSFRGNVSTNQLFLNANDDSVIQYRTSNSSDLSADGVNAESGNWQSPGTTATTSTLSWTFNTQQTNPASYGQVRDAYGNVTAGTVVVPAVPSNVDLRDISDARGGVYREFLSWLVFAPTSSSAFASYDLYRSTNGTDYSLLSSVTNSATNYYVDGAVASTTTYHYRLRSTDADGDVSGWSAVVSDTPDGQGGTDFTPPTVSSVTVAEVQGTWARITWTTDELANSRVEYSVSPSTAYNLASQASSYTLSHSVTLSNLTPNTQYLFRVKSIDVLSNTVTSDNAGQGFTFTTLDVTQISQVTSQSVTESGATVVWYTNRPSNSYVLYATSQSDLGLSLNTSQAGSATIINATSSNGLYEHRVTLSGLAQNTTYYYYVKSIDSNDATATDTNGGSYYSFITSRDLQPPTVSNVLKPVITANSAVLVWTTNELSNSQVEYGITDGAYTLTTSLDTTQTISHVVTVDGLSPETTYYFRTISSDAQANTGRSLGDSFTTTKEREVIVTFSGGGGAPPAPQEDKTPPVITNIEVQDLSAFSAKITFNTSEPATAFAQYGKGSIGDASSASPDFKQSHSVTLQGLTLGTTYAFKLKAYDKSGNVGESKEGSFTTKFGAEAIDELRTVENAAQFQSELEQFIESVLPTLAAPFLSNVTVGDITEKSALVTWRTNVSTYGSVAYGTESEFADPKDADNPYPAEIAVSGGKVRDHEIKLTELAPGTKYHIQARAFSIPGVVGKSKDITFATRALKVVPEILKRGNTQIEVRWTTPGKTSSFVEFKDLGTGKVSRSGDNTLAQSHTVRLENLTPDTNYELKAFGYDAENNIVEADPVRVRTSKDVTPPTIASFQINNALLPGQANRLQTVISWKTDEPADSTVYFEEGAGAADAKTLANEAGTKEQYTLDHTVILTSLKTSTVYRIFVVSTDESGNTARTPIRTILTPKAAESVLDVIIKNFEDSFNFLNQLQ